jgi:excinuclease ABC subunit C
MKEVIIRRYTRLAKEEQDIPQLLIVDGGKGQLSSAVEAHKNIIEICEKENITRKHC